MDDEKAVKLRNLTNNEKSLIPSEGIPIIDFDTIKGFDCVSHVGGNYRINQTHNSNLFYAAFNNKSVIYEFTQDNVIYFEYPQINIKYTFNFLNDFIIVSSSFYQNTGFKIMTKNCKTLKEYAFNGNSFFFVQSTNKLLVHSNGKPITVINLTNFEISEKINISYFIEEPSYFTYSNFCEINDKFCILILKNQITCIAYFINITTFQCSSMVNIGEKLNHMLFFDFINGIVFPSLTNNINKNHCMIIVIKTRNLKINCFEIKHLDILNKLFDKDYTTEINTIVPNKFWLIAKNFYYVFDVEKQIYLQKFYNILSNCIEINQFYLTYFSGKTFFKVNINLKSITDEEIEKVKLEKI